MQSMNFASFCQNFFCFLSCFCLKLKYFASFRIQKLSTTTRQNFCLNSHKKCFISNRKYFPFTSSNLAEVGRSVPVPKSEFADVEARIPKVGTVPTGRWYWYQLVASKDARCLWRCCCRIKCWFSINITCSLFFWDFAFLIGITYIWNLFELNIRNYAEFGGIFI